MQDLIVALYANQAEAVALRTALVTNGFPTDRLEVTAPGEHRQAGKGPAVDPASQVADYFRTLAAGDDASRRLGEFARAVLDGAATVTVHPRGAEELKEVELLMSAHPPRAIYRYVPEDTAHVIDRKIERAAAPTTAAPSKRG